MTELFAVYVFCVAWALGFLTCGALIGATPFWDGVRDGLSLRLWRRRP